MKNSWLRKPDGSYCVFKYASTNIPDSNNVNVMFDAFWFNLLVANVPFFNQENLLFSCAFRGSKWQCWPDKGQSFLKYLPVYWKPYLHSYVPIYLFVFVK